MIYQLEDRRVEFRGEKHYVAPNASVIGSVTLHDRVTVWFNAVVRGDNEPIEIGEETNIQDGVVLHTDDGYPLKIGRACTIGHMAMLHGCIIGDGSLVGIGAVILNGAKIGKNCVIGANALVAEGKEIPDGSLVVGSPGRIVRTMGEEEIGGLREFVEIYLSKLERYSRSFKPDSGVHLK